MSDFAKDISDLDPLSDEEACAGFSACPEGDEIPMDSNGFNRAFCWLWAKVSACFDALDGVNIGTVGAGLFSSYADKTFSFKRIISGKNIEISEATNALTINSIGVCCYSETNPAIPAGPPPATFMGSILVDDCTDPQAPILYIWSCKSGAYFPLGQGGTVNQPPECDVHAAQIAQTGVAFSYDASSTDPESDPLTYTQIGSWPSGFSIDPATGIISAPANFAASLGLYLLEWTISDGNNPPVTCMLSLTVQSAGVGPDCSSLPDTINCDDLPYTVAVSGATSISVSFTGGLDYTYDPATNIIDSVIDGVGNNDSFTVNASNQNGSCSKTIGINGCSTTGICPASGPTTMVINFTADNTPGTTTFGPFGTMGGTGPLTFSGIFLSGVQINDIGGGQWEVVIDNNAPTGGPENLIVTQGGVDCDVGQITITNNGGGPLN